MRYKALVLLWCLLSLLQISPANASIPVDTLQKRLNDYHIEKPYLGLYVHLDKNKYIIGDTIWFKAYMLSTFKNEVLYVRMTDQHKDIVLENRFPVYDIRSHGELVIPEDLPEGTYYFYAFTDCMMSLSPGEAFVQPLKVGKNQLNRLEAEASVVSPKKIHRGEPVEISVKVKGSAGKILKGTFRLSNDGTVFKNGRLTANSQGYAYIRFNYPTIADDESVRCDIRFDDNKDVAELTLNLRHEGNTLKLKAYPEGGHLLEGVPGRVILETKDERNNPLTAVIGLLENGKIMCTTESDKFGLSELSFTPKKDAIYQLRITENGTTCQRELPCTIETSGVSLKTHSDKKNISTVLYNTGKTDSVNLVVRSFNKVVWHQPFHINTGDSVTVNLPAADLPDWLLNLAVFDTTVLPRAERLLNNPKGEKYTVGFTVDQAQKNGNTEAKVTLHVSDSEGKPVRANLSVSIVEKNSVNWTDYRTIQQVERFKNLTVPFPYNENDRQIGRWLTSKNLAKYDWTHVLNYKPRHSLRMLNNPAEISGRIVMKKINPFDNDKLHVMDELKIEGFSIPDFDNVNYRIQFNKDTINLAHRDSANASLIAKSVMDYIELFTPSENGYFSIPASSLIVKRDQMKVLKLVGSYTNVKSIELTDYSSEFDNLVRYGNLLDVQIPFNTVTRYIPPSS